MDVHISLRHTYSWFEKVIIYIYGSFQLSLDYLDWFNLKFGTLYCNNQNKQATKMHITVIKVHVPGFRELQNEPTYIKLQTTKLHVYWLFQRSTNTQITTLFQSVSLMFGIALGFTVTCTLRTVICTLVVCLFWFLYYNVVIYRLNQTRFVQA